MDICIFAGKCFDFVSSCVIANPFLVAYSDAKNMATDVRSFVLSIVQKHGGLDEAASVQYVKKMEAQKRYSADVWS